MRFRLAALLLLSLTLFPSAGAAQTLDEVERPLLPKGKTAISAGYGQFEPARERLL